MLGRTPHLERHGSRNARSKTDDAQWNSPRYSPHGFVKAACCAARERGAFTASIAAMQFNCASLKCSLKDKNNLNNFKLAAS
jgi:hypothetical protein